MFISFPHILISSFLLRCLLLPLFLCLLPLHSLLVLEPLFHLKLPSLLPPLLLPILLVLLRLLFILLCYLHTCLLLCLLLSIRLHQVLCSSTRLLLSRSLLSSSFLLTLVEIFCCLYVDLIYIFCWGFISYISWHDFLVNIAILLQTRDCIPTLKLHSITRLRQLGLYRSW